MIKKQKNKGFTLIELIVVMTVIGVLVLLAMPKFIGYTEKARLTEIKSNVKQLENASERYYINQQDWPRASDEPYTAEELESFAQEILDKTGAIVSLETDGSYYPISYDKLQKYVQKPKDGVQYILQNPVGEVFYLDDITEKGKTALNIKDDEQKEPVSPILTASSKITNGKNFGFIIQDDGRVYGWGNNDRGQLGLGDKVDRKVATEIPALYGAKQIVAGDNFTMALMPNGTILSFGGNQEGQLGLGDSSDRLIPTEISSLSNVIKIQAGFYHSMALLVDGTVMTWGTNGLSNSYASSDFIGQLGVSGISRSNTPVKVDIDNVKNIFASSNQSFAIKEDGTVFGWGDNTYRQLGLITDAADKNTPVEVPSLFGLKEIQTGMYYSLALMNDGSVLSWGQNAFGQLGRNGTSNNFTPTKISGIDNAIAISIGSTFETYRQGDGFSMILTSDNKLFAFGYNNGGALGLGDTTNRSVPTELSTISNVIYFDAGARFVTAKTSDGKVYSWGYNTDGQLAIDNLTTKTSPVEVIGLE